MAPTFLSRARFFFFFFREKFFVRDRLHREIFFFSMLPLFFNSCILVVVYYYLKINKIARTRTEERRVRTGKLKNRASAIFSERAGWNFPKSAFRALKNIALDCKLFRKIFRKPPLPSDNPARKKSPAEN